MHKKFLTGLLYSLTLNLGVKALWILGIEVAVQRTVGTENYGDYFTIWNFTYFFVMLLDLGLTNFNTRNISQHEQLGKKHFPNLAVIKTGLGFIYLAVTLAAGLISGFRHEAFYILLLLSLAQFFNSFTQYLRSNISARLYLKLDSIISVLDRFLLIILIGGWIFAEIVPFTFTVFTYAALQAFVTGIVMIAAFLVNIKINGWQMPNLRNPLFYLAIFRKTLPFALLVFLMTIYMRSDAIILNFLLPDGSLQTGIYAAAFRLFDAFSQVAILFSGVLLPVFSHLLKKKEQPGPIMELSVSFLGIFAIILSSAGLFYHTDISRLLYDQDQEAIAAVLRIYMFAAFPFAVAMISGTLLTAAGKMKQLNYLALITVIVSVTLNFILVPHLQAMGSAITALVTYSVSAILQMIAGYRYTGLQMHRHTWTKIILLQIIGVLSAWGFYRLEMPFTWFLIISPAIILAAAIVLRLIQIRKFIAILRDKNEK